MVRNWRCDGFIVRSNVSVSLSFTGRYYPDGANFILVLVSKIWHNQPHPAGVDRSRPADRPFEVLVECWLIETVKQSNADSRAAGEDCAGRVK